MHTNQPTTIPSAVGNHHYKGWKILACVVFVSKNLQKSSPFVEVAPFHLLHPMRSVQSKVHRTSFTFSSFSADDGDPFEFPRGIVVNKCRFRKMQQFPSLDDCDGADYSFSVVQRRTPFDGRCA